MAVLPTTAKSSKASGCKDSILKENRLVLTFPLFGTANISALFKAMIRHNQTTNFNAG
jgi:hypothetical protein